MLEKVSKQFKFSPNVIDILRDISFSVDRGETVGIRGENGAGKTTLFNIIAGIETIKAGNVRVESPSNKQLRIGFVFQNYTSTLLPWLNVADNISIPLKILGLNKAEKERKLGEFAERFRFDNFLLSNYPNQLSGGQKQKVAIARALIQNPDLLILDEPFSNLDFSTSLFLLEMIQQVHLLKRTAILVTSHNIDHILYLADRLLVLGDKPTTIIKEFAIDTPRPRIASMLVSQEFKEQRNRILEFEYETLQKTRI